jgi:hypothetical protein
MLVHRSTSRRLLEESYRVFLVLNYSLIAWLLLLVPYVGRPFAFMFMVSNAVVRCGAASLSPFSVVHRRLLLL